MGLCKAQIIPFNLVILQMRAMIAHRQHEPACSCYIFPGAADEEKFPEISVGVCAKKEMTHMLSR